MSKNLELIVRLRRNATIRKVVLLCTAIVLSAAAVSAQVTAPQVAAPLAGTAKPELVVQTGHSEVVLRLQFSPDGQLLATADLGGVLKVWDVSSGAELRSFLTRGGSDFISFGPDNGLLGVGGPCFADFRERISVGVYDLITGKKRSELDRACGEMAFSKDGKLVAGYEVAQPTERGVGARSNLRLELVSFPGIARERGHPAVWNLESGQRVLRLPPRDIGFLDRVEISPDGKLLAVSGKTTELWDLAKIQQIAEFEGTPLPGTPLFGGDGKRVTTFSLLTETERAQGPRRLLARTWDIATGKLLAEKEVSQPQQLSDSGAAPLEEQIPVPEGRRAVSRDGKTVAVAWGDANLELWNRKTGKRVHRLTGTSFNVFSVALNPEGTSLVAGEWDSRIKLWDLKLGQQRREFRGGADRMMSAISPDGKTLAACDYRIYRGGTDVSLWDVESGKKRATLPGLGNCWSLAFSQDGKKIAAAKLDFFGGTKSYVKLWDVATGAELRTVPNDQYVAFSPDGRIFATAGALVTLWELETGKEVRQLPSGALGPASFSPDGKRVATFGSTIRIWDVRTGEPVQSFKWRTDDVFRTKALLEAAGAGKQSVPRAFRSLVFSPDGQFLASAAGGFGAEADLRVWEAATGRELSRLSGHHGVIWSLAFSPDGKFLITGGDDTTIRIWDVKAGKELASLVSFGDSDWAVVDPEGRFDASPGGMKLLHWVVGLEPIALDQLKARYFEPGLLAKILGFNKEPLRDVSAFDNVALFPEIATNGTVDESGKLHIDLKNRGGGIGEVQIFVNGKELLADARGPKPDSMASKDTLTLDLSGAPVIRGKNNEIRVVAWNREGYLSSRGVVVDWKPAGEPDNRKPELYAIVSGISDYASPDIRLNFASKDAEDMARALELGGNRLFGAEHVHMTVLSTAGKPGELLPTKANLKQAFEAAQKAQPGDVLVVYLAGHGVAIHDTYAYPTQESRGLDLTDTAVREKSAITSEELVEWIKKIPALHQVMILDTCAAGAAATKLVEKRDVPSDQIRAIDRLKDRTGFHVLMGSAADASSYEASQYGQGLLTYTLLQGMRGAALKDDLDVDVSKLFQYAADRVPELARNIGGIQRPLIAAPQGVSFPVGQLQKEDREAIPLAMVKPLILRPVLINAEKNRDNLGLMAALRKRLREESYASARGESAPPAAIFVDEEELPGAITPSGSYTVSGTRVVVKLVLSRDDKEVTSFQVEGSTEDPTGLVTKIADAILQASKTL